MNNMNQRDIMPALIKWAALIAMTLIVIQLGLNTYLKNQAVDACMENSITTWKNGDQSAVNFTEDWFKTCLTKKGYK